MHRDHEAVVPGHQAQRRHVRREGDGGLRHAGARIGGRSELRVAQRAGMAMGPSGIGAVHQLVDRLGRALVTEEVASHVRRPRPAGVGIDPQADRVAQPDHPRAQLAVLHDLHRCAPLVFLVTDVAGGADAEQDASVGQDGDRLGGVEATDRQVRDHDLPLRLAKAIQRDRPQRLLPGHEEGAVLSECEVLAAPVPTPDLDDLVRHAILVGVGQRDDAVRITLGDEQDAVGRDGHEARVCQAFGEDAARVALGELELRHTAASAVDVHAEPWRQLRAEGPAEADDERQGADRDEEQVADAPHAHRV